MNKFKMIEEITKMVSELERTIKTLEEQSKSQKNLWKETKKYNDFKKHMAIEKGISEIKDVVQALVNANNWAKRIGE